MVELVFEVGTILVLNVVRVLVVAGAPALSPGCPGRLRVAEVEVKVLVGLMS